MLGKMVKKTIFLLLLTGAAQAQQVYSDLSGQPDGLLQFHSVTPRTRYELAHRSYPPQPTVIQGTLAMPTRGQPPYPAMVLAHGSGGIQRKDWERWVPLLRRLGIATFVVDSFTTRKIGTTIDDQAQLDQSANDADALSALKLLASDPRIDPARIGVMGFSRGGIVALETANEYFRRGVIDTGLRFAAHIAFYPGCSLRYWRTPSPMTGAPIMMALAGADDYTPARPCIAYGETMRAAGQDIEIHVYQEALHDFDNFNLRPVYHPSGQTQRNCPDREIDPASWEYRLLASGQTFRDLPSFSAAIGRCASTGVTTGGNRAAAAQAEADVQAFLARVLKP